MEGLWKGGEGKARNQYGRMVCAGSIVGSYVGTRHLLSFPSFHHSYSYVGRHAFFFNSNKYTVVLFSEKEADTWPPYIKL